MWVDIYHRQKDPEIWGKAKKSVFSVADPGFGQGGGQEFFSEILPM